jgi:hypothetical protein
MRISYTIILAGMMVAAFMTPVHPEENVRKLSRGNLHQAREFIMAAGRPLEQALYRLRFENGSADAVRSALTAYQNADGGFGKALEPDLRAPESSVLATIRALHTLAAIETPPDHPSITRAMAYLTSAFDEAGGVWRIIPPSAGAHPHAPWWNQENLDEAFGRFLLLPRGEVLGYLFKFNSSSFPTDRRLPVLKSLLDVLESSPDHNSAGVESCVRLYETGLLPADFRARLWARLAVLGPRAVEHDAEKWKQYCLKPIWLVRTPESPAYALIADAVERNLDYEIQNQGADGSWAPNWSWFGEFPETWPIAEKEWRSILTMQTLETLQAFGRIGP